MLEKCLLTILELNKYEQPRDGDKKLKICCQVLTSFTQPQNGDVISCLFKDDKDGEMYKNARARGAKLQFFIAKYSNLIRSLGGYLNFLIMMRK